MTPSAESLSAPMTVPHSGEHCHQTPFETGCPVCPQYELILSLNGTTQPIIQRTSVSQVTKWLVAHLLGDAQRKELHRKQALLSIHFLKNYDSLPPRKLWLKLLGSSQLHLGVGSLPGMESWWLPGGGHDLDLFLPGEVCSPQPGWGFFPDAIIGQLEALLGVTRLMGPTTRSEFQALNP